VTDSVAPLLEVDAIACERDGRVLFDGLCLRLEAGRCLELRGPNGSGKSTLLKCLAGLYPDYTGTIHAAESLYFGHRPGISALLTAAENLRWFAVLRPGPVGIDEALARVGMDGYQRVGCQQMSAGQQRRVGLARLLVCPAALWLLDEPLTALDASGQALVREMVQAQLAAGGAVVGATPQPPSLPGVNVLTLGETRPAGGAS
jgi:heme exporter protein A